MVTHKQQRPVKEVIPFSSLAALTFDLNAVPFTICGSLRRGAKQVGDIDIVVPENLERVTTLLQQAFEGNGYEFSILSNLVPKSKTVTCLVNDIQMDLYAATGEYWGAMTLFLTGSAFFNIAMRGRAKKDGLKLSQYGLFHGDTIIAGKEEEQIFFALDMPIIYPSYRSLNRGDSLDKLIESVREDVNAGKTKEKAAKKN